MSSGKPAATQWAMEASAEAAYLAVSLTFAAENQSERQVLNNDDIHKGACAAGVEDKVVP